MGPWLVIVHSKNKAAKFPETDWQSGLGQGLDAGKNTDKIYINYCKGQRIIVPTEGDFHVKENDSQL